ncbi:transcriptional repressor LexA [Pseudomarimonas arenosa]|uniref:LexA repressor n=1 Tax=Pseudomarimonas arenosa TaxID=2774145 RepID=A0AAW3ZMK2_9GAMM|nr:transcriptional repressor LexA [Pseudomarimonas arenosa]MBD8527373.1 transcriptional repressor LexA [Pseudomarimonas arenosa]
MQLTDTQTAILELIAERLETEGVPPSQTEIAAAMGFKGVRAAQYHLDALEKIGAIERVPGRARGIRLKHQPAAVQGALDLDTALRLPVLGQVAAGRPIEAGEDRQFNPEDYLLLDRLCFHPTPDYLLRVRGDSMRDDGILEGDLIGVHSTREARSGQTVIARLDDEVTVKRLSIEADRIRLLPRNPEFAPIEVTPDQDFAIEGLYCGLLRTNR